MDEVEMQKLKNLFFCRDYRIKFLKRSDLLFGRKHACFLNIIICKRIENMGFGKLFKHVRDRKEGRIDRDLIRVSADVQNIFVQI